MMMRNKFLGILAATFLLAVPAVAQISGGGSYNPAGVAITGGTINGAVIGGTTPASVTATSLSASTATLPVLSSSGATITGGTINGTAIGGTVPSSILATNVTATGTLNLSASTATLTLGGDTILTRDAANIFAQRNGTSPQALKIYNTYTNATNYESGGLDWQFSPSSFTLIAGASGTGANRNLAFATAGSVRWNIDGASGTTPGDFIPQGNGTQSIGQNANRVLTMWGTSQTNSPPVTTTVSYTILVSDAYIICNGTSATLTMTLPTASNMPGRVLMFKNIGTQLVISASANVVPLAGGSASTAMLAATAGKWLKMVSDGTNWVIMAAN